ncbi:MAG: protocatechuate 3,4-dioxygenase beta subunit [Bradymonadia bacterium]|jgi:protocatechuate 3,4-dioxygenase beta subunit
MPDLNRREALAHLALSAGAVAVTSLAACDSSQVTAVTPEADSGADAPEDTPQADLGDTSDIASDIASDSFGDAAASVSVDVPLVDADFGAAECLLAPSATAGPYYFEVDQLRRDITEGKPGETLQLGFRVMDDECNPIPDAVVDIWHCDASGYYAGFADADPDEGVPAEIIADEDETFLRGIQATNADGIAEFRTIYPGFYRIRAVHIHVKVHLNDRQLATTQTYFPDSVSDQVYQQEPYSERSARDVYNEDEGVVDHETMDAAAIAGGHRATITLQVRRG